MTIAFKPTATETTIEHNGSAIATLDSTGLTMAAGKTIVGSGVGKILQVVSTTKTSRFTTSSASFTNVTGFSASITPSSTSSKILVIVNTTGSSDGATGPVHFNLTRAGTSVYIGDAVGSAVRLSTTLASPSNDKAVAMAFNYLDSPSTTSAITYQVQVRCESVSFPVCVGGSYDTASANVSSASPSTITLMEVAA